MDYILKELKPNRLWNIFEEISAIPRPSKHEEKIIKYVKDFGENLGLDTIVDNSGNVIIRKPATKGKENSKGIILQAHLDMVPQKNNNISHDFLIDSLKLRIDNGWVKATDTTLGADNGIGVATALAIIKNKNIDHGPIEVLLTSDEETGMTGAFNLEENILNGDILLNLDSEDYGEICIGCAGGINTDITYTFETEHISNLDYETYEISISGLLGGHSGVDINLNRGNAIKILANLLKSIYNRIDFKISNLNGGSIRNAIPREASAIINIKKENIIRFQKIISQAIKSIKTEFNKTDKNLSITINKYDFINEVLKEEYQKNILLCLSECPNGVISMDKNISSLVETSTNIGLLKTTDNKINIVTLQRSSKESEKIKLADKVKDLFEEIGCEVIKNGSYPGWNPNPKSKALEVLTNVYKEIEDKDPDINIIHAGLECGLLGSKYPNWEMVSFGPTIKYPHSPDEKVNIESVEKFWTMLIKALEIL